MGRISSFMSGIIMGAMIGAAAAILLAPTSGEELRIQLTERAETLQREVKNAAASRRAELEQQISALRAPRRP